MTTSASQLPYQASAGSLARASIGASAAAAAILLLFVLPAEWGIDPTGAGKTMGLTRMAQTDESAAEPTPDSGAAADPVLTIPPQTKENIAAATPWRTDAKTVSLAPHSGIEIKAHMAKGDRLIFRWAAKGGAIRMDMHGEPMGGKNGEFTSYWKQKDLTEAQGSFIAPFDGTHGWYWRNGGETPVSIELKTAGFYRDLFEPPVE
ncbi:MAG: hypothetical protein ABIM50_01045 [Novosphingobium sp.]